MIKKNLYVCACYVVLSKVNCDSDSLGIVSYFLVNGVLLVFCVVDSLIWTER